MPEPTPPAATPVPHHVRLALEHGRPVFVYHAGQRIQSLNFYFIAIAVFLTGFVHIITSELNRGERALAGVALGVAGIFLTRFFHGLDKRNQQLVECDEALLKYGEEQMAAITNQPVWKTVESSDKHAEAQKRANNVSYGKIVPKIFKLYIVLSCLGIVFAALPWATDKWTEPFSTQLFKPRIREDFPAFGATVGPEKTTIYPALNTHVLRCNKPHVVYFRVVPRVPQESYRRALYLFVRAFDETTAPDESTDPDFILGMARRSVDQIYYSPAATPSRAYFFDGRWTANDVHHSSVRVVEQQYANGMYRKIGFSAYPDKKDWDEFEIEIFVEYRASSKT